MALSALDSVDDALEATKRFLLPFDRARWFRLAVIMFFVSGVGVNVPNVPSGGFGGPEPGTEPEPEPTPGGDPGAFTPEITPELVLFLVGLVVFLVALAVLWAIAGAVMEFVFVESLSREDVRLWTFFKRNVWPGVRLFLFRFGVWVLSASLFFGTVLALGVALGGWPIGQWSFGVVIGLVLLAIPMFLFGALVVGILLGFTNVFVVPVMFAEGRGVISAWRRFWQTLVDEWKEYVVYLVVSFLLSIAVGIAVGFLTLIALVVLAIPFAIVGIPLVVVLGFDGLGALVVLVLGLMFVVVMVVVTLLIQVPFQTFLRYYALLVLGDTDPDFDVIPDARAAVRADGGEAGAVAPGEDGGPDDGDGPASGVPEDGDDGSDGGRDDAGPDDGDVDVDDGRDAESTEGEENDVGWDEVADESDDRDDGETAERTDADDDAVGDGDETSGGDADDDDGWNVDPDDRS